MVERALEVGHGDALVDHEALDLVEHRRVRGVVLVGAEHPARADDVDGWLAGQHRARLDGRGLGAQHDVVLGRLGPEGVLHGARRVVGPEVERVEVEPLGLDDRALGHLVAHGHEEVGDELGLQGQRVPAAAAAAGRRQGDVDGLLDQHPLLVLRLEHGLAGGDGLVDGSAGLADALAGLLARLRRQGADLAVGEGEGRTVAGVVEPDLLEGVEVGGGRDRGQRRLTHRLDLVGLERGHFDRVVVGVGAGHGSLSRGDSSSPQSLEVDERRVGRGLPGPGDVSCPTDQVRGAEIAGSCPRWGCYSSKAAQTSLHSSTGTLVPTSYAACSAAGSRPRSVSGPSARLRPRFHARGSSRASARISLSGSCWSTQRETSGGSRSAITGVASAERSWR